MRFRTYKNTDLTVSELGFGLWTISTGWWRNVTEGEAIGLMHKAFKILAAQLHEQTSQFPQALTGAQ